MVVYPITMHIFMLIYYTGNKLNVKIKSGIHVELI